MKTIILALCIFAVAFAAPGRGRRPLKTDEDGNTLPPPMKDDVELTKEEFDALVEACEALADDEEKRQDEPELEEVCRELAKMLEEGPKGPRPTQEAEKRGRKGPRTDEDGNTLPPRPKPSKEELEALIEECEALAVDEKRQDEPELEEVCRKLAKLLEEGPKGPRPTQEAERRGRGRRPLKTDEDGNTLPPPMKDDVELTEEEFDALIEACEALADDEEKRQDEPELEEVCRELAKMLEEGPKGPRPTQEAEKRGRGRRPLKTDEDGNTLPPPIKDDVELTEEEFDALIEACEALADDEEKRQDEPELEEVCRELAKMLEEGPKGPRPTQEAEKRGRKGQRTDEDCNTLPPRPKPSKEEFEALVEECEALAGDQKRQDEPEMEEVCRKLAKLLEEGPKEPRPTQEAEKRADLDNAAEEFGGALVGLCQALDALVELANSVGNQKRSWESILEGLGGICTDVQTAIEADMASAKRGMVGKGPRTDEDGNTLPPRPKPSKEEVEALVEECEALAEDGEKRQDEPELEEICKELAKMLEKGPKGPRPTQEAEKRGGRGPRTDEDGNTLPPRPKLSKDELEALKEECEALANDGEKRQDEPALEEVCIELAKMMRRPRPRTDEDGNPVPRPTRPAQERRRFHF